MDDGQYFNRLALYVIDEPIRGFDQLADIKRSCLGNASSGFRKRLGLPKAKHDSLDGLLRVDGRDETNVLRDGAELIDCVLRPAERETHEARRIRLRTRAMASSWETVRPAAESASPVSTAWRT